MSMAVKRLVNIAAKHRVATPVQIPVCSCAQALVLARVVPIVATDVPGRRHCSKSMVI